MEMEMGNLCKYIDEMAQLLRQSLEKLEEILENTDKDFFLKVLCAYVYGLCPKMEGEDFISLLEKYFAWRKSETENFSDIKYNLQENKND